VTIFAMQRLDLGKDSSGRDLVINRRTKAMLDIVEEKINRRLVVVQGSYMAGTGAKKSAKTHNGGGVVDIRTRDQTVSQVKETVLELRKIGFAAWRRTKAQGFDDHIHAVAIGDPELDPSAVRQVKAYQNGKNGLKSGGKDDGPRVKFEVFPVFSTDPGEDDVTPEEAKAAFREVLAERRIRLDWNNQDVSFFEALSFIHFNAADGSFVGEVPATSNRQDRRGTPTSAKAMSNAVAGLSMAVKEAGREIGLTPAQIDALAASVAAKVRP
jgi:hypothetical protein